MDIPPSFPIVLAVAFLASLLSSMSGAGAALLTTPVWISLGFPLPVAIASNQLNGAAWTLIAARNYLHGKTIDWRLIRIMIFWGISGAYAGTFLVRGLAPHLLQHAIGIIIIALVVVVAANPTLGSTATGPVLSQRLTGVLAFPLGVYEAFFGSGNGLFTSLLLAKTRGMPLLNALGSYYLLAFFWNCFAVAVYSAAGLGNSTLMVPSTIGSVLGAYFGSRIGRWRGNSFVRAMAVLLGAVLGLKMALGW